MRIGAESKEEAYAIAQLKSDMRRMLAVQFKEFVHHIEDREEEITGERISPVGNVAWISMYDRSKIA